MTRASGSPASPAALRLRALLLAAAVAPAARADELRGGYVLPGAYVGYGKAGGGGALSYGGELSVMAWTRKYAVVGGWLQVGRVGGPEPHTRAALGAEVMFAPWFGFEVGGARLWLDDGRRGHTLAVSPFASLGLLSLSLRTGVPLDNTARDLGIDIGLILTAKLPYPIGEPGPSFSVPRGRPFGCGSASLSPRCDWG